MPIYEYRCTNGHQFEAFQAMSDDPVEVCEVCGAAVERLFSRVAVHYKGSGFYATDYAKKGATNSSGSKEGSSDSKSESKGESKSESGSSSDSKKSDSGSGSDSGSKSKSKD